MRRVFETAAVERAPEGCFVVLDGRPLQTPQRDLLALPTAALAEAVAEEWRGQAERIRPQTMPLTRLAATAIDRVRSLRDQVVTELAGYAATDLLCYRDGEGGILRARQDAVWQPVLDWLHRRYDVHLAVTAGIRAVPQSETALGRLQAAVAAQDEFRLAGLHALTTGLGSLVLGLAVLEGELAPEAAFAASQLEEAYQVERWGIDREAEARRQALRRDMLDAARFLALLQSG